MINNFDEFIKEDWQQDIKSGKRIIKMSPDDFSKMFQKDYADFLRDKCKKDKDLTITIRLRGTPSDEEKEMAAKNDEEFQQYKRAKLNQADNKKI